jgi:hypothetical protein
MNSFILGEWHLKYSQCTHSVLYIDLYSPYIAHRLTLTSCRQLLHLDPMHIIHPLDPTHHHLSVGFYSQGGFDDQESETEEQVSGLQV